LIKVVQEAAFARRLYLWCGHIFVDWWILLSALHTLDDGDIGRMVRIMGSLIRREPTAQISKRLARSQATQNAQHLKTCEITDEEIRDNIKGALSFMTGVLEIKRSLGLQCYDLTHISTKETLLAGELNSQFSLLTANSAVTHLKVSPAESICLSDNPSEVPTKQLLDLSEYNWHRFSIPFTTTVVGVKHLLHNAKLNASFFSHNLDHLEPSQPEPISLLSLITRFRNVGASDPRDKVYAFLHLATETPGLLPNYRASVQTVYRLAARLLWDRHSLAILSHVQDPGDTKVVDLPSWIPDLSVPLGRTPFVAHDGSSPYSASGAHCLMLSSSLLKKAISMAETIPTCGYVLDTISSLAESKGCYFTRTGTLALQTPKHYVKNTSTAYVAKSRIIIRIADIPNPTRVEALWRTLIADNCSDTYPAPVATGFGFAEWVAVHLHHSCHLDDILEDHAAAVTPSQALIDLQAHQARKRDVFFKLDADEPGKFRCYECSRELWDEKKETFDSDVMRTLDDLDFVPEMNPVRYLPDADRINALRRCARSKAPESAAREPKSASPTNCPVFTPTEHQRLKAFENRMREVKRGRRMFRTKGDLMGMGPKSMQEGDVVCVLLGAKVPFVLRAVEGEKKEPRRYRLVGEAFVFGYMNGEILEEKKEVQTFWLV
jgi:hypothetical protein